ncbi:MAG TPA: hypothetical protein VM077_03830 [Candidatus Limnocylindrales bacterium]|nr:hypothetical protein [Candidatus Limnocylindrales bacterium]
MLVSYYNMPGREIQPTEHRGAFAAYQPEGDGGKVVERLVVVSNGRLLQRYDTLPLTVDRHQGVSLGNPAGLDLRRIKRPTVIGFLNKADDESPDCVKQVKGMEDLYRSHSDTIDVVEFSLQPPDDLTTFAQEHYIAHPLLTLSQNAAIDLGVALKPDVDEKGEDLADGEFWNNALCRMIIVVGMNRTIAHIEQVMDQAQQPNYEAARLVAINLL